MRIYNHGVSRAILAQSEGDPTAILNQAGLEVRWVDCPLTTAELVSYLACQETMGAAFSPSRRPGASATPFQSAIQCRLTHWA